MFVDWLEDGPKAAFKTDDGLTGAALNVMLPLRVLAGVLMVHHGSEGALARRTSVLLALMAKVKLYHKVG